MRLPPLLSSRPERVQGLLVLGAPIAFGLVCGILLGISGPVYIVATLIGIPGGYLGGMEHDDRREGLLRGAVGGLLFGGTILFVHAVSGADAKADLPDPPAILMLITGLIGTALGGLGARARIKREGSGQVTTAA